MLKFLFSGKGRTSRGHYWKGYVLMVLAPVLVAQTLWPIFLSNLLINSADPVRNLILYMQVTMGALTIFHFWTLCAVASRRFHDMGYSGWWAAAFPIAGLARNIVALFLSGATLVTPQTAVSASLASAGLLMLVQFWVLGAQRGQKGPNRYGPDPLDQTATSDVAEVFS